MLEITINDDDYPREIFINGEQAWELYDSHESPTGESGCSRSVYMTSTHVIKFGGIGEAFLKIAKKDLKHFAKTVLVDIEQNWLVQERVDCEPTMCTLEQYKVVEKLCDKYGIGDVSWTSGEWGSDEGDHVRNTHNWIVDKQGIPVIFDYEENRDYHRNEGYS